ncbi:hypothetical protein [Ferrimonas marina]|uniref:hypothetical protein n=1 Tax=Ferrimonas marina TaxID=299255 RepID=UPI000829B06F|nr:hypothetical protein [Ferrimonas marina]
MESAQEIGSADGIETLMLRVVQWPSTLAERWRDTAPIGVAGEVDHPVDVAALPLVADLVILAAGLQGLDLDTVVVGAIGDQDVGLMAII